ncbi:Protein kish-B [Acropora cervicornis]|uniref:Protein kish n=1 Tax=Acropora cervicornis TaxID=6130 RepID=A0AAD9QM93_ACRCE|nr:Protein kish-B [Acropora cervicornis]
MNVYSFDGLLVLALLMICTCAYITKVPRLKSFFLSEKKAAVIGIRLHWIVALSCVLMSLYILVLK